MANHEQIFISITLKTPHIQFFLLHFITIKMSDVYHGDNTEFLSFKYHKSHPLLVLIDILIH
jgi:hypothetical protein